MSNGSDDRRLENGSKWTHEEMALLYNLKRAGKTYAEISEIMASSIGRREYSENLCHKKWQQTDWTAFNSRIQALDIPEEESVSEKARVIENTLATQERLVRRENARTELIIDAIKSSIYRLPKPKSSDISYFPKRSKYSAEHVGLMVSDVHAGACYNLQDTGGLSEYNIDIFRNRIRTLKETVLNIVERHRLMYPLPELHVFCLGDIVAGMNDAGQWSAVYIDQDIYDQMMLGVEALKNMLASFAGAFEKVHFYGIYGNHGRVGRKGMQKDSTNWDRITYEFTRMSLQNYENIEWNIPSTWWLQKRIMNHNFYMAHGDGIRGSMGIPYYGVERAERNIIGLMDEKPDYVLIGHFHSAAEIQTNSSRILMNGSFMGGDMYSLRDLGRIENPEQKMFGIHDKKGVTWSYNIHLDAGD